MTWKIYDLSLPSLDTHVVPLNDYKPHELLANCWCRPTQAWEGDVFAHNAMDGRELFESGERRPS